MRKSIFAFAMGLSTLAFPQNAKAEVDPNFYIYLCFGQSNMEGNAKAESMDQTVDKRFRLLATCNYDNPKRTMGQWYDAKPPLVNSMAGGLGPTDYFGRTMVAALPSNVRIGVVPVAMGGSPIEMFDKDKYAQKLAQNPNDWWATIAKTCYGGNPYGRLIEMAKKAQEVGVIKGILLHQGCSNNGDPNWPNMVKKIYNDMLTDLGLSADSVPLFVGETLRQENGGSCYGHNVQVNRMPSIVPTSHVISSEDLPGNGQDSWHFSALGYRIFGKRYAFAALELMGKELYADTAYVMPNAYKKFYLAKSIDVPTSMSAMPGQSIPVKATFNDNHKENVSQFLICNSNDLVFENGALSPKHEGTGTAEITYRDFLRNEKTATTQLDVKFFPLKEESLTLFKGTASFNNTDSTFSVKSSSQIGWRYDAGADMSDYGYIIIKLKEPILKSSCAIRIYAQNDVSSSNYYNKAIGKNDTLVVINLNNMVRNNKKISPTHISIISLYSTAVSTIKIDNIYLSQEDPTGIETILSNNPKKEVTYDLQGRKVSSHNLRGGIYIRDGKKVLIK